MHTMDEYHVYYDTSADNFTAPKDAIQVFDVPKTKTYLNLYSRCFEIFEYLFFKKDQGKKSSL